MPSPRTRYVLEMLRSGHTTAEVAQALGISEERVSSIVWAAARSVQPTYDPRPAMLTPQARAELLSRMAQKFQRS
jgi:FixJ family two-component response regulator